MKTKDKILYKGDWHYAVAKEFVLNSSLSRDARFLFIVLKSFTNDKNKEAFPSRSYLTQILGCTEKSLSKYLDELEDNGYIVKSRERRSDGTFEHNVYEIAEKSPNKPRVKSSYGKSEDLTNGSFTNMVSSHTNNTQYINIISLAANLISNPGCDKQIEGLSKVVNKYKSILGSDKLRNIIGHLWANNKEFNSISDLAAYLHKCQNNVKKQSAESYDLDLNMVYHIN